MIKYFKNMTENLNNYSVYIEKFLKGDETAASELLDLTYKSVFKFCLFLTGNKQLAEDICHDTYVKALKSLKTLKNHNAFLGWLKQIARNLFFDYKKSSYSSKEHLDIDTALNAKELTIESDIDIILDVMNILKMLPDDDRILIILVEIQGLNHKEAAQVLEIKEGTVKSRLFRIKAKINEFLGNSKAFPLVSNL